MSRGPTIATFEYLVSTVAAVSRPASAYCGHGCGARAMRTRHTSAAARSSGASGASFVAP